MRINNERGCIFGGSGPKMPSPPPPPAPAPVPVPAEASSASTEEARRKRLERLRSGLAGTIKTSARGIVGAGAELKPTATGKSVLGV